MRKQLLWTALTLFSIPILAQPPVPASNSSWKSRVTQSLPRLGHRNWILVVDSAYPLQNSSGIETIDTNSNQLDVLRYVLGAINSSRHVRPVFTTDAELPFVNEDDAPGVSAYRKQWATILNGQPAESLLHDRVLAEINDAGSQFHILVLKTNLTIPYTSVFIRLDCKYWSADQEKRMRDRMAAAAAEPTPSSAPKQ